MIREVSRQCSRGFLRSCRRVMPNALIPCRDGDGETCNGHDRDERSVSQEFGAVEQAHGGVKRREAKGDDPAQEKLYGRAVNRKRVTPEGNQIPCRRMHADAVLEPEGYRGQKQKDGNVDRPAANGKENEEEHVQKIPGDVHLHRSVDNNSQSGEHLLKGLDSEILKHHLEERRDGPDQDAVELAFHDVFVSELVEVYAQDIEQPIGHQGKAIEEEHLFKTPARETRDLLEEHEYEPQRENRRRHAGQNADQEISAMAHPHLHILEKILREKTEVAANSEISRSRQFIPHEW